MFQRRLTIKGKLECFAGVRLSRTFSVALRAAGIAAACAFSLPAAAGQPHMELCYPGQPNTSDKTCVVDGDTLWLHGDKIRLKSFDTPEPQTNICGGASEVALAHKASSRLIELLNSNDWTIETGGVGGFGRTLGTIRIDGRDVGDILIEEGLARRWPDGDEWWCK